MSGHTPEPWFAGRDVFCDQVFGINGHADPVIIAACDGNHANAARIVACVNACAGIANFPDEGLKAAIMDSAIAWQEAIAQRNLLEVALSNLLADVDCGAYDEVPSSHRAARDALAKAQR